MANTTTSYRFGGGSLALLLIVLKLARVIQLSWVWVLAPIWIIPVIFFMIVGGAVTFALFVLLVSCVVFVVKGALR